VSLETTGITRDPVKDLLAVLPDFRAPGIKENYLEEIDGQFVFEPGDGYFTLLDLLVHSSTGASRPL
jgi:hypothetical protein